MIALGTLSVLLGLGQFMTRRSSKGNMDDPDAIERKDLEPTTVGATLDSEVADGDRAGNTSTIVLRASTTPENVMPAQQGEVTALGQDELVVASDLLPGDPPDELELTAHAVSSGTDTQHHWGSGSESKTRESENLEDWRASVFAATAEQEDTEEVTYGRNDGTPDSHCVAGTLAHQSPYPTISDAGPQDEADLDDKVCSDTHEPGVGRDAAGGDSDCPRDHCPVDDYKEQHVKSELPTCLGCNDNRPDIKAQKETRISERESPGLPRSFYIHFRRQPGSEPNNDLPDMVPVRLCWSVPNVPRQRDHGRPVIRRALRQRHLEHKACLMVNVT